MHARACNSSIIWKPILNPSSEERLHCIARKHQRKPRRRLQVKLWIAVADGCARIRRYCTLPNNSSTDDVLHEHMTQRDTLLNPSVRPFRTAGAERVPKEMNYRGLVGRTPPLSDIPPVKCFFLRRSLYLLSNCLKYLDHGRVHVMICACSNWRAAALQQLIQC